VSRTVRDPKVLFGKPRIAGTRIAGETVEDIPAAHPRLTPEDVRATPAWAAEYVRSAGVEPAVDGSEGRR